MEVVNEVLPTDVKRIEAMQAPGPSGPIVMVNLLKFRERAEYPADHPDADAGLSGREAYDRYASAVVELLHKFGGRPLWAGDTTFLALGQVEELWDEVALVEYPDRAALWAMSTSSEWQAIAVHRAAGLAGQLNIEAVSNAAFAGR